MRASVVCVVVLLGTLHARGQVQTLPPQLLCQGAAGIPGSPGNNGQNGAPGRDGRDGSAGEKGALGNPGSKGDKGEPGITGKLGPKGADGPLGLPGLPGSQGLKGECAARAWSAFSVKILTVFPPPGIIKYDVILSNDQGHYDVATGKFTCVYPGYYFFIFHGTTSRRHLYVQIMLNGVSVANFHDAFSNAADSTTGSAMLHLKAGDQVWVNIPNNNNGFYGDVQNDCVFSGFLLHAE